MRKISLYISVSAILLATPAHAYIGPGASAGVIATVIGVLAAIFLAFVAIIWYPIKRLVKRLKGSKKKISSINTDAK